MDGNWLKGLKQWAAIINDWLPKSITLRKLFVFGALFRILSMEQAS